MFLRVSRRSSNVFPPMTLDNAHPGNGLEPTEIQTLGAGSGRFGIFGTGICAGSVMIKIKALSPHGIPAEVLKIVNRKKNHHWFTMVYRLPAYYIVRLVTLIINTNYLPRTDNMYLFMIK